eukprot:CAMPEP_0206534812 /NCGR_PEP_ID=MMETSP0325_2-20121206/5761_1 /ASSEMBLY_ACC=CAM_ASM_000347 /TAXON_ID=2866 /ORGANISM="Crypthecodinium cohnii, Strain Seligo" /LENGTH=76 /DNA_ID=CAMNT_0054031673 /DNA_START=162 /DNA_END=392 /DNA_ORIENTATION=-
MAALVASSQSGSMNFSVYCESSGQSCVLAATMAWTMTSSMARAWGDVSVESKCASLITSADARSISMFDDFTFAII